VEISSRWSGMAIGATIATVPQALILIQMVYYIVTAVGNAKHFASLAALWELVVVPLAVIACIVAAIFKPTRSAAVGVALSTAIGFVIVVGAAIINDVARTPPTP
jgi:hypothetical protein